MFLDSDILVRGDLKGVFELDCDFAAACNHSCRDLQEQIWHEDRATLEAMSCTVDGSVYFNGGVLYFNDTAGARRFSLEWHRLWLKSSASQSHCRDQPALNAALHIAKPRLAVLADDYNAQLRVSPAAANGAKIWHYYSFKNGLPHTLFELYVQKLLSGGELRIEDVAAMIKQHHPWRRTTAMDDLAAARIMQRNRFDGWEGAWLRRALGQHLKCLGGNVWTRARQMVF